MPLAIAASGWPTPSSRDGDPKRGMTAPGSPNWARKVARGSITASGLLSDDLASSAAAWATPSARDRKGRDIPGRSGAPSLPDQVMRLHGDESSPSDQTSHRLWPTGQWSTPCAGTNRKSERAMAPSVNNGRRSGGGQSSPPGLEQQAEAVLDAPKSRLNPRFVAWLMGLPETWAEICECRAAATVPTNSASSVTESFQPKPSAPSESCGSASA
jgi:hypothetical protein